MQISWLGEAGIRLQTKDAVILIDPPAQSTGFKPTRQSADVVVITTKEGRDAGSVGGDPMIIDQPGEFERKNAFIYGLNISGDAGRTHYRIEAEDISVGHLGGLDHKLENGDLTQLEGVDVLIIPVGNKPVLNAEQAAELISQIEPRIVIPIQYKTPGGTTKYDEIEKFLKEFGAKNPEPQAKYKISKKDLPAEDTQVVVLTRE